MSNTTKNKAIIKNMLVKTTQDNLEEIGQIVTKKMKLLLEGYVGRPTPLLDDIQYRVETGKVVIFTTSPITRYLEEGTEPHLIRPKNGKALKFRAGNAGVRKGGSKYGFGDDIYTKVVKHPGTEARPFFYQALFLSKREIEDVLSNK